MTADPSATDLACTGPPPGSRRLDRRALIGAGAGLGAGLVFGAEPGQTSDALAAPPSADVQPPSAGETLMTEHGVLKRLLLVYQTASHRLAAGDTSPAEAITETAEIIGDYIEGFHEGLEEGYVFPRVRAAHPRIVRTLLVQHDRGRHLTAGISYLSTQNLKQAKARTALHRYLDLFVAMYSRHEAWEDTIIFPTIRAVTRPKILDELAARFVDLETARYGDSGYAHLLDRVHGIEQQLGIGELASFTPPEINPPYD